MKKIPKNPTVRVAVFALLLLSLGSLSAQQMNLSPAAKSQPANKATHASTTADPGPGERKFQANCSRCHTAPEQISPRIAGTIVRHMRVRASLSAQDEQDILHFLAP